MFIESFAGKIQSLDLQNPMILIVFERNTATFSKPIQSNLFKSKI